MCTTKGTDYHPGYRTYVLCLLYTIYEPMALIPFLIFIAIVGFSVWYFKKTNQRIIENFQYLANKHGLEIDTSVRVGVTKHPSVWGKINGYEASVRSEVIRGNAFTRYTFTLPRTLHVPFAIYSLSYLGRGVMIQDHLHFTNPTLDKRTIFASPQKETAKQYLSQKESQLAAIFEQNLFYHLKLEGNTIEYLERLLIHTEKKRDRAEKIITFLTKLAEDAP